MVRQVSRRRHHAAQWFTVLFLLLGLVVTASACGGNTSTTNPADSSQAGSGTGGTGTSAPATGGSDASQAEAKGRVILASTTSTQDSGLMDVLTPMFEMQTGYQLDGTYVGTGQALQMAKDGNADVVLVHAPSSETPLVDDGTLINYQLVMHNDFLIVGPESDPAGIKGIKSATEAMTKIRDSSSLFVSRGDDSGTNKLELQIWKKIGVDKPSGDWYQETGQGMGDTLRVASEKSGYTITDRATFLNTEKTISLVLLVEGDPILLNIYHVAQVNPDKFPDLKINAEGAKAFVDFMTAPETQQTIADFGKDKFGQSLFFADAGRDPKELGLER